MDRSGNRRNYCLSIGIILCMIGVSLGGVVKLLLKTNFTWLSTLISALSIILMIDVQKLVMFKYRKPNKAFMAILIYSLITLFMCFFSRYRMVRGGYGFVNQLVYFCQIVILWDRGNDIDTDELYRTLLWIMLAANITSFLLILRNSAITGNLFFTYLLNSSGNTTGVSRTTMGAIGFLGFIVGLSFRSKTLWYKIVRYSCMVMGVAVLGLATRRSIYLAVILVIFVHIKNRTAKLPIDSRNMLAKIMLYLFFILVVFCVLYQTNDSVRNVINKAVETLLNGIRTYLGFDNTDLAASYRREIIESIPKEYIEKSSFFQLVFGRGYMTDWLDIPFMQAFWDMGLIGGIFYFIIMGVFPVCCILKPTDNMVIMFAQYNLVLSVVEGFANGAPYGRFFALVLLFVLEEKEKLKMKVERAGGCL